MADSRMAASSTVRAMGPAVSCVAEMGMMPARETRPTVGLWPTSRAAAAGDVMEPSVSVPMPAAHRLAATAVPVPLELPDGERSSTYGLRHCPPRPLQPLIECVDRKLA